MSKQSGLGDNLYVDGVDLSGDTGSLGAIGGGPAALEATGIDKEGHERLGGQLDGRVEWSSWFNPDNAHPELSQLVLTNRIITYCRGTARGNRAASLVGKQIGYDPTRGQDGSLTIALQAQASGFGIEWGRLLTGGNHGEDVTGTGALTGVDYGSAIGTTAFGLQAYLQLLELTGTDIDVAVQHSDDDGSADAYADVTGAVFSTATGTGSERVETARDESIKRWLRVNIGGTFTTATLAVVAVKNIVEVPF